MLGLAHFDPAKGDYTVIGSGENIWFGVDYFHFVWKKMSGDVAISRTSRLKAIKATTTAKRFSWIGRALTGRASG